MFQVQTVEVVKFDPKTFVDGSFITIDCLRLEKPPEETKSKGKVLEWDLVERRNYLLTKNLGETLLLQGGRGTLEVHINELAGTYFFDTTLDYGFKIIGYAKELVNNKEDK
ncbi:hypothetical protein CPT_Moonbeam138 [Bacillus phage Moonbeam]|uniref:Uncharacterized protein n=1 Tax=Bacillus phage Moonbeam TaxID=1540091 RepID=A0A0A0RSN1_9CAUD|nr:hypothetical protein CPT_Moonbeam138 [Bacillus phage Moonbeam]AIW03536.1 hypothetical protein CPT_Moonbeam138 [Bacillus phage Moonbeam]